MKRVEIKTSMAVYESSTELESPYQSLLLSAKSAANDAYAPYSAFYVGAAVLLENGEILKGGNQENAAYPTGLCAERTALSVAASLYPQQTIKAIAVTVQTNDMEDTISQPVAPCGSCRQAISEVENRYQEDIKIIMQGETGLIYVCDSIKDLLPLSFNAAFLPE